MIIAKERFIRPEDLPERLLRLDMREGALSALQAVPRAGNLRRILAETEKQVLLEALRAAGGNKAKAAKILGIHRTSLYEKIKTHGLDPVPDQKVDFSL
jgi:DNA-binding NtrC family response regulator